MPTPEILEALKNTIVLLVVALVGGVSLFILALWLVPIVTSWVLP